MFLAWVRPCLFASLFVCICFWFVLIQLYICLFCLLVAFYILFLSASSLCFICLMAAWHWFFICFLCAWCSIVHILLVIACACCWCFLCLILTAYPASLPCCWTLPVACFCQMSSLWLLFLFHTVLSVCCWFSCVTSLPFSYFFCLAAMCVCIWSCVPAVGVPVVHVYLLLVLPHLSCLPAADWFIWLKSGLCSSFSSFSCKCVCCVVIHVLCACCWLFMHIMSGSLWVLHNLLVCLLLIC